VIICISDKIDILLRAKREILPRRRLSSACTSGESSGKNTKAKLVVYILFLVVPELTIGAQNLLYWAGQIAPSCTLGDSLNKTGFLKEVLRYLLATQKDAKGGHEKTP
jgi:hypothetical protein